MHRLHLAATTLRHSAPLEVIDAAAAAGYDGVGLRLHPSPGLPYHPVLGNASLIREMQARIAGAGLEVCDALAFYLQPSTDVGDFVPALELAAQFRARFVLVQGDDADARRLAANFAEFCERAGRLGLIPALEFVPSRPLCTLAMALKLIGDAGARNAVLCIDPLHLIRSGGKPSDLAGLEPRLLPYAQFSDGTLAPGEPDLALLGRMPIGRRCLPGAGSLPLRDFLASLPKDVPLSVEVLLPDDGPHAGMAPHAWARLTLEASRRFLQ